MASTLSVVSLTHHNKPKNANKPRLSPKHCREITDHWKYCVGAGYTNSFVEGYTNPAPIPSAKGPTYRLHNMIPHHVQRAYSVSTGGRRNPGRGDGQTWNSDSFICPGQIDPDCSEIDPSIDSCVVDCGGDDECDYYDQEVTRPRTIEISLADVPMKVRKPKQRKAHGYEVLPSVPRVTSIPSSELGEPPFHQDFETISNFSWDAMDLDNLSVFSGEDWEDLESAYTHDTSDYDLDRDPKLLRVTRDDSGSSASSPSTTPPQRTYAQALANKT